MSQLRIDVWSDVVCPWCYVGKRRLEKALAAFPQSDRVEVVWRSFELDPSAPREAKGDLNHAERLARKYGMSVKEAESRTEHLVSVAANDGLALRFERTRPGNTFDAHRLLHLARKRGVQNALKERLMRGYFTEGEAIGDREVLARLGADAGLDEEEARAVLATDQEAEAVRADERRAAELGIHGVPCFVFGERYALSGAQPPEQILAVLKRVLAESPPVDAVVPEGDACGPEGC